MDIIAISDDAELEYVSSFYFELGIHVINLLGRGSNGTAVFRVQDPSGTLHAEKIIPPIEVIAAEREFKALNAVQTCVPCPRPLAQRTLPRGELAISMSLVPGKSLASVVQLCGYDGLPSSQLAKVSRSLLSALAALLHANYAHNDIKPDNIQLDNSNNVYLLDFGCAAPLDAVGGQGNFMFQPPELLAGEVAAGGHLGDAWAVGILLFYMATGRLPVSWQHDAGLPRHFRPRVYAAALATEMTGGEVLGEQGWPKILEKVRKKVQKCVNFEILNSPLVHMEDFNSNNDFLVPVISSLLQPATTRATCCQACDILIISLNMCKNSAKTDSPTCLVGNCGECGRCAAN